MGRPKMLLPWEGASVLGFLIAQWQRLGAAEISVVHAARDRLILAELDRLNIPGRFRIPNPDPERGMFSSVQCAAAWPQRNRALTHFVLSLGDQPHLHPSTLATLLDFARNNSERICQPSFRGRAKHPVVLPKEILAELERSPAGTLKEFLESNRSRRAQCELDDPGLELDLDRPEDYERALQIRAAEKSGKTTAQNSLPKDR